MHFTLAFVLAALPFLAAANPLAETVARSGMVIPLARRSAVRNTDGSVNFNVLNSQKTRALALVPIPPAI